MLDLHCGADFSLVAASGGYSSVAVHGLLPAVASLVAKHGLYASAQTSVVGVSGPSNCGSGDLEHRFNSLGTKA